MARKSRKVTPVAAENKTENGIAFKAALYARISVENERKREADSIGTQIQLLKDYVSEQPDIELYDIYVDDNISGTNFVRPEFSRMIADLREKRINCIIVKDLSRLGRNFLEAGEYIELIFPFFNCRFISITDSFDTKYKDVDLSVQLKNFANEMYAKDISKKITSSYRNLQQQGQFMGAHAPYGYLLDPEDRHHLIIDPEVAPYLKQVFELKASGMSCNSVAVELTNKGIPSPGFLLYKRGLSQRKSFKVSHWHSGTVKSMLKDEVYLGWTVAGKYRSSYLTTGVKETVPVAKDDWIIVKGTHEPIISQELFDTVQDHLSQMHNRASTCNTYRTKGYADNPFRGRLRCGECGHSMTIRRKKNHSGVVIEMYECCMHSHYHPPLCPKKDVKRENVEAIALKLIQTQIKLFTDARSMIVSLNKNKSSKTRFQILMEQIKNTEKQIASSSTRKSQLYEDYCSGVISLDDYVSMTQEYDSTVNKLNIFLAQLQKDAYMYSEDYAAKGEWAKLVEQYQDITKITADVMDAFIETMTLYQSGQVEVSFRFNDELDEVVHLAAIRKREADIYGIS